MTVRWKDPSPTVDSTEFEAADMERGRELGLV
jgi:hypothetical protein